MEHQGEALRTVLTKRRISLTDLATRLKVSRTTLYYWFDQLIVPYEHLESISDKLKVDIFEEIREVTQSKTLKFYKPLREEEESETVSEQEPQPWKFTEKTMITLLIDGTEDTLSKSIEKLKAMSKALSAI